MSGVNLVFAITVGGCALMTGLISLWAYKRKTPMHFWAGSTVKAEEITDVPAYNRANAKLWLIYTIAVAASGFAGLFHITVGAVLLLVVCVPGSILLMIAYGRIYKKYKNVS